MPNMYFIAIVLPGEIDSLVLGYKHMMLERYDCRVGLKSPAHITLIPPFWMDEEKESQLLDDIGELSKEIAPFEICTDNFSAFKPKTIFIATKENYRLNEVQKKTVDFFKERPGYKIKPDTRPFHPHITIATRDLPKKAFHEAWDHFNEKIFNESCLVNGISVLRHNKKNWDVIYTSQFKHVS